MDSFAGLSLSDRKLIVGIDFGTTFSGVAWAETRRVGASNLTANGNLLTTRQSDHQSVIESWPATLGTQEGSSSVKVPTEVRYTPQGTEWGFQIPPVTERHQWFKLSVYMWEAVEKT
jgi:molecular chaperone DnaK (HSP70)